MLAVDLIITVFSSQIEFMAPMALFPVSKGIIFTDLIGVDKA
jgi:hypothetical protein